MDELPRPTAKEEEAYSPRGGVQDRLFSMSGKTYGIV